MDTFNDRQCPFPLFAAPVAHADVDEAGVCVSCGQESSLRFSEACYSCFRAGKVNSVIDTEFGMVRHDDAVQGRTHGIPLNKPHEIPGYELAPHPVDPKFPDATWFHIQIKSEFLLELLRTPKYHTWQGETWLFCCQRPMVFRGSLPSGLFRSVDEPLITEITDFLDSPDWASTVGGTHGSHTYYVFVCSDCGQIRFNEDCD